MNVNNSKLLLFIAAILEHVPRNRSCSIGKLRTHIKKHVITEPSRTPGSSSEPDPCVHFSTPNHTQVLSGVAQIQHGGKMANLETTQIILNVHLAYLHNFFHLNPST